MATKEEIQELLESHNVPNDAIQTVIQELDSSSLRKKVGELEAWKKDVGEPAVDFKQKQETLPKRKEAFKRVGIDYDAQKPYAQDALDAYPDDKLDDLEAVAEYVQSKGFEVSQQPESEKEAPPPAQAVVSQALGAGGRGGGNNPSQITPDDYASWSHEQRMKFQHDHPDATKALARGEVVSTAP